MGIIAIIFSAPASPLPLHGERVGDLLQLDELLRIKGSLFFFLEGDSKLIMKLIN